MSTVFVGPNLQFTGADPGLNIFGGSGNETVRLTQAASTASVNSNVERLDLTGAVSSYTFQVTGNVVMIRQAGVLIASVVPQDDAGGTRLRFADGGADLSITGLNQVTLGGVAVSTMAGGSAITPMQMGMAFDTTDLSSVGSPPPPPTGMTFTGTPNDDTLTGGAGNDSFNGGGGNDIIDGGAGIDVVTAYSLTTDGADKINLGVETAGVTVNQVGTVIASGNDVVNVSTTTAGQNQIRVSFISAEVGNSNAVDSNGAPGTNQPYNPDGGLAVRLQGDAADVLSGSIGRSDDEGVTFKAAAGTTFDVRDLVSGAARGDQFNQVVLGTSFADNFDFGSIAAAAGVNYYVNAGMGNDILTGNTGNDFLVGGAGNDTLTGGDGKDSYIGGGGDDTITDTLGVDTVAAYNLTTDGADKINTGVETAGVTVNQVGTVITSGNDVVNVSTTTAGQNQIRVSFISAEVGNNNANDSNGTPGIAQPFNPDGGLAVRLQGDAADVLSGSIGRSDDEGITFKAAAGTTFDVRDLVSGAARGDQFNQVVLGTGFVDNFDFGSIAAAVGVNYYVNAGMGDDVLTGNTGNDFLVGGAGNDTLTGGAGTDSYIGGAGSDVFVLGIQGADVVVDFAGAVDRLQLSRTVFTTLATTAGNTLGAAEFVSVAGGVATDAAQRVIYDSSNGQLFFDADGNGASAAAQIATLTAMPGLSATDIFVVA